MKRFILVGLCVAAIACSADATVGCPDPKGMYHVVYTTQSGDCNDIPDEDLVFPSKTVSSWVVTGSNTSADNCSSSVSLVPGPNTSGFTGREVLSMDLSRDGSSFTGTITYEESSYIGHCSGTYTFTGTRTHQ